MALSKLTYTKNWNNPEDFPTYEARESQVRADMQLLYDEIQTAFNKLIDDLKAAEIPFESSTAVPAANIQAAIENVQQQVADIIGGTLVLPNRSVAGEKLVLGAVDTTELHDGAVTTAKLDDGAVTTAKLDDGAVTADKLASNAVTTAKIVDKNVTTAKLDDAAVTSAKLGTSAVLTTNINNGAVTEAKLGAGAVTEAKIGAGAVTEAKIGTGAVTEGKIGAGAVTEAKIGTGAVTENKLGAKAVATAKLDDKAVTTAKLDDGAVTPAKTTGVQPEHKTRTITVPAFAGGSMSVATVNVSGVTNDNTVIVSPAPSSFLAWRDSGVYCFGQSAGQLTFKAESAVTAALTANVIIMN